jgi:hypothetical protein
MSTNDMPPIERAARLAKMILDELVADKPLYRDLTQKFKDACIEAGVDPRTMLISTSHELCSSVPSFQQRLERRAAAVATLPPLH